jgi:glycosyltransferase involved in cell wall biosynthesis
MKLHFIGLPHTTVDYTYEWCAYSVKLLNMSKICKMIGYETILYGTSTDGSFTKTIPILTPEEVEGWFGHIDWNKGTFGGWDPNEKWWQISNERAIEAMKIEVEPGDVICIIAGRAQEVFIKAFPNNIVLEWAVGYEGVIPGTHRCYESEIWRHFIYGRYGINDGQFYDAVIPNSFDISRMTFSEEKGDYILYLGRLIPRKGLAIVEEVAKHQRVVIAGQGDVVIPGTEYLGVVRGPEKAKLLAEAKALICPTTYIEPFGGVAVEAQLSGTPVICTDFGAFTETVVQGVTGYRCRSLQEFLDATDNVKDLKPSDIAKRARDLYTLEAVAPQWKRWYDQIQTLYGDGWYTRSGR